jgi:DNA-directed RNA polymerase subunit RPC12/RpoP
MASVSVRCPQCGRPNVVSHVTIRWAHARGSLVPERGYYCVACGNAFDEPRPQRGSFTFHSVQVPSVTSAIRRLQESADVVVVRHRTGMREVLY